MKANKQNIQRLVGTAILAAIVVVLQTLVSIPIGMFTITLTLVPIILGAILFGPSSGAFLGAVFGVTVAIQVVTGAAGIPSYMMFEQRPVITLLICVLKGTLAGLASGWIYKLLSQKAKMKTGIVLSAIACPICNTGIFCIGLVAFYNGLATSWAIGDGYTSLFVYILLGVIGLNFLVEFAVNVLLIPVILRIITIIKKKF